MVPATDAIAASPVRRGVVKTGRVHGRKTDRQMSDPDPIDPKDCTELGASLKALISDLVDALVQKDEERYESDFAHLLARVRELVDRKLRMEGTKTDTRDFVGELVFTRLRRGMHLFLKNDDQTISLRAAEWVMGVLFAATTLSEFAKAFDKALIRSNTGTKDFNFAGRTDFISAEEVMQMLAAGKHLGCLSLEKDDNRLDIYLKDGRVFFLDPHHMIRRVLPGDSMRHREIPESAISAAETARAKEGTPVLIGLKDQGVFRSEELREVMRLFGKEVLFDFMRESEPYAFYYRKLDALPAFAEQNDLRLGVTSILLEGSKLLDDWRQMLLVFPNPDAPIEPKADMFARMGDVALGVLEIKLLSQINGDTSPRGLVALLGLPLADIYQLLIKLSREGILAAPGDQSVLGDIVLSVEESMQEAFAALDANDDKQQRRSALDAVLGDPPEKSGASALDRVLGGDVKPAAPAAPPSKFSDLDRELLSILRKGKN